jgi:hypothetical protein
VSDVTPHNLEAEKCVLGAILINNAVLPQAASVVETHHFFRHGHRVIFDAMGDISLRNEPIDTVVLKDELERTGRLEDAGGPAYVSALTDGVPRSANVGYYARIVRQHAAARDAIRLCTDTIKKITADPAVLSNGLPGHHRELWNHITQSGNPNRGLPEEGLVDAVDVAAEGRRIEREGIPYLVDGLVPQIGGLGFNIAYTKVGKTTFSQSLAGSVAAGRTFLDRETKQARVLMLAPEDPPEYTQWLARHLDVPRGQMTFYMQPIIFNTQGLSEVVSTVRDGGYGLVHAASLQAICRGLIRDENDNAGAVRVVEDIKAAARQTGVPWLIDAHAGKSEDQSDDADPTRALRGASSAAGAADYLLSLRYANGAFGTQRRLSGKGRFVSFEPILMNFEPASSTYTIISETTKNALTASTWCILEETRAVTTEPRSINEIAATAGLIAPNGRPSTTQRRHIEAALRRPDVGSGEEPRGRRGNKTKLYRLLGKA